MLVDADDIARRLGVCRRTVISAARKSDGVEYLGNKAFVDGGSAMKLYGPSVANMAVPVRGKHKTLQEVADILGCSRSTVLRVIERTGLGITIGKRRYVPEYQMKLVKQNVLSAGVTTIHKDKEALSERGKAMARTRWSQQADAI